MHIWDWSIKSHVASIGLGNEPEVNNLIWSDNGHCILSTNGEKLDSLQISSPWVTPIPLRYWNDLFIQNAKIVCA